MGKRASPPPLIGVIVENDTQSESIEAALCLFEEWSVAVELEVASAAYTPARVGEWAAGAEARGMQAIIAAGEVGDFLAAAVAAHTNLPVIAVVRGGSPAISEMPEGVPVAFVSGRGAANAAVLALQILARTGEHWAELHREYRESLIESVESIEDSAGMPPDDTEEDEPRRDAEIERESSARIRPIDLTQPLHAPAGSRTVRREDANDSETARQGKARAKHAGALAETPGGGARRLGRVSVDAEMMDVEITEEAVECLLEGGIVAVPTETVYGLAVDATNLAAVARLFALKGRSDLKPVTVFIDSQRLLASLVRNLTADVKRLLEAFWPGPLTVVFERRGPEFAHLSHDNTIGVRLPDHSIPLTLMQELERPIACTSANPSGEPPATTGERVERYFGSEVNMILDAGPREMQPPSSVIDVSSKPYRLVREGSISRDQICAVIGDLLAHEDEEEGS